MRLLVVREMVRTFLRNLLQLSSWKKIEAVDYSKTLTPYSKLHGVTSQITLLLKLIAVRNLIAILLIIIIAFLRLNS
jgi:hypothetical protein